MGFPVGYSELLLPKLLLHVVFLLGSVRRLISWAFDSVGLGDLLLDSDAPWPADQPTHHHHHHHHPHPQPEFQSVSAMLIQEILPVVRFEDLLGRGGAGAGAGARPVVADGCAVCLYEFEGGDEVRRLSNCRHVFHRCCLDRWMEHDQRTCPLCRTPLIPEEMQDAFNDRMWAAAGLPDSYSADFSPFPFAPHRIIASPLALNSNNDYHDYDWWYQRQRQTLYPNLDIGHYTVWQNKAHNGASRKRANAWVGS